MTGGVAPGSGRWGDLGARVLSSLALGLIGIVTVWLGGVVFALFVAAVVGIIVWELTVMAETPGPILIGGVAGMCCLGVALLPPGWGLPLVMLPALLGFGRTRRIRLPHAILSILLVLAGYGMVDLRIAFGAQWLVWLVLVVVATDVAGYFVGRQIGGPKFWPRISPKKTWSGTIGGWVAAALVGAAAAAFGLAGPEIVPVSIALSMAAQMGDIVESAVKRRVGVKDSSALLPGHGGFFDRFDGVLGAAIFLLLVEQLIAFPPIQG
ncbi:MAG: phosphatidate cytidylyltransferase [Rhodobacteraceae bacterium]|nr:phosphatidate cytidylyltransferase [Paracoccaceae bacterium]